ncbi:MAG: hypothetical protein AAFU73_06500 [Planctomycetota bacterium]
MIDALVQGLIGGPLGLVGAAQAASSDAVAESWKFLEVPAPWIVALVLVPGSIAIAWLAYFREPVSSRVRAALVTLRALSFLVLLAVLFRPVLVHQEQSVLPPEALFLYDDSGSMARVDGYVGDDDARAQVAELTGRSADDASRARIAEAVRNRVESMASERGYVPRSFRFAEDLSPLADGAPLSARGTGTAVGDAIRASLSAQRGRYVTDLVLVGDGRSNVGSPLDEAARVAQAAGISVSTVLVGDERTEINVAVEVVDAPEVVLEGDEIEIAARVSGRGTRGRTAELLLEEISNRPGVAPRLVAAETVPLEENGDRVVLVAGRDALDVGASERRFRLRVEPLEDERVDEDNVADVTVRINTQKIRVLFVDGYPRYSYRFLQEELRRMDERVQVQMYLMSATPDFAQDRTRGLPALESVPTSRDELLDGYDVVILGDVNPYDVSPDPAKGAQFVRSLREFVERGGGLCVISGQFDMPRSVAGTEFTDLLPVEIDRAGVSILDVPTKAEHGFVLSNPAAPHEIVRLEPDVEVNRLLWESERGLRGFFWHYPVRGVRPGAETLLSHPTSRLGGGTENDPLLVVGYYPAGRTMYLAIEATHRWRNRYGYRYYESFWRGALRWLALGRMRSGDRRFELASLRSSYDISERVTLEARVLDEDYEPSNAANVDVALTPPDGERQSLVLDAVAGRPGLFRGTLLPSRPGRYGATIEPGPGGPESPVRAEFSVVLPSRESADPSPDPGALERLARETGGVFATVTSLDALEDAFPEGQERREPVSAKLEDAWDRWLTLLLALGLLGAEWIVRKWAELV